MRKMFSLEEILTATEGKLINKKDEMISSSQYFVSGVSKDTRTIEDGNLYVAIKGERFDGHDYITKAMESGALVSLISDETKLPSGAIGVLVEDTVKALGDLAKHYRFKLGAKVIAVTGSVGKTSTREIITCALKSGKKVHTTKANQNNEIGLPTTILEAPEDTEVIVVEMGMRLRGEISYLTNIACPDIAIITNVGYCHIERLGSREEILYAKNEITEGITDGGILAVNSDDDFLFNYVMKNIGINYMVAGVSVDESLANKSSNCPVNVQAKNIRMDENGSTFDIEGTRGNENIIVQNIRLNVNGLHNIKNACFAILCSAILEINIDDVLLALSEYKTMAGRGASFKTKKYTVINDAYNASPESMEAAFLNLNIIGEGKRKVLALGGILELGDWAPKLHEEVGKNCGKYNFDHVFVTGDQAEDFIRGLKSSNENLPVTKCTDTEDVKEKLKNYVKVDDVILFKASHSFGFEKLADEFILEGNK